MTELTVAFRNLANAPREVRCDFSDIGSDVAKVLLLLGFDAMSVCSLIPSFRLYVAFSSSRVHSIPVGPIALRRWRHYLTLPRNVGRRSLTDVVSCPRRK